MPSYSTSAGDVPLLDPRTVILLTGLMSALMSLVLYALRRNYPASIRGLGEWAAGPFFLFVSSLLAALRAVLPDVVSIVFANFLLFSGLYLFYIGSQRFFGVPPNWRLGVAVVGLAVGAAIWFGMVRPDYRWRLLVFTPMLAFLFLIQIRLLWIHGQRGFSYWFMMAVLLAGSAIQLFRFALELVAPIETDTLAATPRHQVYLAAYAMVMLLFAISLVLMATDRLRLEFEHLATHDSLTDAFTRRHMAEACRLEMERSRRSGRPMSLLALDLDHFKSINDRFGHQVGDRALITFVGTVRGLLRQADQLGRFGGEEFVVLLPETPTEQATAIAERIRAAVQHAPTEPRCTVSIGVASLQARDHDTDTLLARADAAMYRAKELGRNRVVTAG